MPKRVLGMVRKMVTAPVIDGGSSSRRSLSFNLGHRQRPWYGGPMVSLHQACEMSTFSKCHGFFERPLMVGVIKEKWKKREGAAAAGLGLMRLQGCISTPD